MFCAYLKCRDAACRVSPGGNSWNCHIHLMRYAARQLDGETSPGALTTNPFHTVYKLQEARRKVCSTTLNSYSTTWNGCFSTWNSYFTSWNAEVYYILLILFLLFCALASKQNFVDFTLLRCRQEYSARRRQHAPPVVETWHAAYIYTLGMRKLQFVELKIFGEKELEKARFPSKTIRHHTDGNEKPRREWHITYFPSRLVYKVLYRLITL